ncbi:uncharacterized protein EURHEDRAFT_377351 [Aspergillus ruber CBS 135680]|uniref:Uncharacterized protein n=1 Tax=Aspergillus ruber (strain CBS 135680) TaxID=1388766 RepID=A0A017SG48_ASPRC|nr:uncharacterized protein EURHEDRAFT_377351 [Aspergillus ruber CBS 135680]EYE95255.1 hypothetical protein EURHEDRAFT_377351 [Aspergillus ruber CBS 135680]
MANIPAQNGTPGTFQQSQDLRVSSSGTTTAVRNEFDIEFEDTCPVENSSIVSEQGTKTNNARGHQGKNVKDIFSSQNAPSTIDSVAEATQLQTNDGDGREIVHHGPAVEVDDVMQEQSHQQVFPSMETANYSNLEQVGTEQEYPDPPVATSLGLPEDHVEAFGIGRQSSARMSPPVCSNSYARISQSPSMGVLDNTLNIGGESRAENIQSEETAVEESKGEATPSHEDENAMDEVNITESLRYSSLGVENPSADTGGRDERPDDNDGEAKTRRHPPRVKTTAGSTSSMANDATREHLCLSQRPQDSSIAFIDGAQEVFGWGILRIQPHGPRNAYIITFLPDVIPPASTPSTSEMPSEKSSDLSDHGPEISARAQVAGNMPGIQNDIPIDPLILTDNGPWEAGDLRQPSPQSDSPTVSEMICPYPDPPPVFCNAPDQQDSISKGQDGNPRSISPPHTRGHQQSPHSYLSTEAGIYSSESPLDTSHGDKKSKSRKRKPHQSHEQSSKWV